MKKLILISLLFLSLPAHSEMRLGDYKESGDDETVASYIAGVGTGLFVYNAILSSEGKSLFCTANDFRNPEKFYKPMLDVEIMKNLNLYTDDYPIAVILLKALEKNFPCN